jgi:hypothetical protein
MSSTVPTTGLERAARVGGELRRLAFWGSVLLPLAYLPVLAGVGGRRPLLLVGLLAVNACCLVAGHGHGQ